MEQNNMTIPRITLVRHVKYWLTILFHFCWTALSILQVAPTDIKYKKPNCKHAHPGWNDGLLQYMYRNRIWWLENLEIFGYFLPWLQLSPKLKSEMTHTYYMSQGLGALAKQKIFEQCWKQKDCVKQY